MDPTTLFIPLFILALWTGAIGLTLGFVRTYFMRNMNPQKAAHSKDLYGGMFPKWVDRLGENYNHIFEQPVVFYAVILAIGISNDIHLYQYWLANTYVTVRILHSIVQITINRVIIRFALYLLAWFTIGSMVVIQLMNL